MNNTDDLNSSLKGEQMTIGNAETFIKRGQIEPALRRRLNVTTNPDEFFSVLSEEKLPFTVEEFDDAYRKMLLECQHEENADQLKEFKMWWDLVAPVSVPSSCSSRCGGGCC
jgi:hypothetical protein